jgi:3'-phosphoadenosine 5'-phosphosulfate (PAPS) 3'-phosphatase
MTPSEQIAEKILALETAILETNPAMPSMLREIHTALRADEELVTTLDESQVAIIVKGLSKQTNTVIVTAAMKTKGKAKSSFTLEDL